MPSTQSTVSLKIFLSGSVHKGVCDVRSANYFWSQKDEQGMREILGETDVELYNPNEISISRAQSLARFQADLDMLAGCDVMIVDARTRKGIGVGAEMMFAREQSIPVVTLCPEGSSYRDGDVFHAFISGLSTVICDSIEEVGAAVRALVADQDRGQRITLASTSSVAA
jgi:hypothetical protein